MNKYLYLGLLVVASITACMKQEDSIFEKQSDAIYAHIDQEPDTKTQMDKFNKVLWSDNDQIVAFMKTSLSSKYQVVEGGAGKPYARFMEIAEDNDSFVSGSEFSHNVAYYPYIDGVECFSHGDDYILNVHLPAEQVYSADSFAEESMPMVAVSDDNDFTFKNVAGGLKLQLIGTQKVSSIKLQGNNEEKISGAATIRAYADDSKPAVVMDASASTSVILNCVEGVQLSMNSATEFIIALPPVLFSKGFKIEVTDFQGERYEIATDKGNTVLRSRLLVMPPVELGMPIEDDDSYIPVDRIYLSSKTLSMAPGCTYAFSANVYPKKATDQTIVWSSDNLAVATIDQNGVCTAMDEGVANISAEIGGVVASCPLTVYPQVEPYADYIDEYGINHGKGIALGSIVWAPVNCGYHKDNFKYGKLYQWGRKYGQGYSGELYSPEEEGGTYSDAILPDIMDGPISPYNGHKEDYANVFFRILETPYNWLMPSDNSLWNSGTDELPVKTKYDPCPEGWRVPTPLELDELGFNKSSEVIIDDQRGCYFSGCYTYTENSPRIFLPKTGYRDGRNAESRARNEMGQYLSSSFTSHTSRVLYFSTGPAFLSTSGVTMGNPIRCVQE